MGHFEKVFIRIQVSVSDLYTWAAEVDRCGDQRQINEVEDMVEKDAVDVNCLSLGSVGVVS